MKESQAVISLGAMAHETRLKIIRHLIKAGPDGSAAGDIGKSVDASPSKVSFHLSNLEQAGLVDSTRVSRHIIYRANYKTLGSLLDYLVLDCCQNDPSVMNCCHQSKQLTPNRKT